MALNLSQHDGNDARWALLAGDVQRLVRNGHAQEALTIVERFHASNPASRAAEPLQLRAQLLLSLGRPLQAVPAFEAAVAIAPGDGRLLLGLAMAHGECGQPEAAEAAARNALGHAFDHPHAHYVLARALFDQDRFAEAEAEFRCVVAAAPQHLAAQTALAELVWMRSGDMEAVSAALDQAGGARASVELCMIKSRLWRQTGAAERACAELMPLLESHPQHAGLHVLAAECAMPLAPERALALITRALQLDPRSREAHRLHGDILLAAGRPQDAARLAARLLEIDGNDISAFALQAAAWHVLGDPRYPALYDCARLVRSCRIDVPPGWSCLDDYLRDLGASLHARHNRLQAHPPAQSARSGTQVELRPGNPSSDRAIRAFPLAVDRAIRRYMETVMTAGADPFSRHSTGRYRFNGVWSVRLGSQGHHTSHFHGKGWISSACHVEVPASVCATDRAGWLTFGRETHSGPSTVHCVRPEPGLLTLFPSWMWHGTVPFTATPGKYRLSVAFDAIPD
jgi:tetratricopeptide (TPR) repeat protein